MCVGEAFQIRLVHAGQECASMAMLTFTSCASSTKYEKLRNGQLHDWWCLEICSHNYKKKMP